MKRIVFITDTWKDRNSNGIVTYLTHIKEGLEHRGCEVSVIHPSQFTHFFPLPTYPEIKMALSTQSHMESMIRETESDCIHIATEGPLGLVARAVCIKNKWRFTTYYHTRLPEYASIRFKPLGPPVASYMKWFHKASSFVFVSTESLKEELEHKGFEHVVVSPLGVNLELFHQNPNALLPAGTTRPVFTFMGRVAPEKNIEDFLTCELPGSKMVIGDGPMRESLEKKYGNKTIFVGHKSGQGLVDLLSASDVFVFPSRTDTFSLAIIEALACGLPIAAYDVQGPKNIVTNGYDGFTGPDLQENALKCLEIDKNNCVKAAQRYSWETAVSKFIENSVSKD